MTADSNLRRRLIVLIHAAFLISGILTILIGQVLPILSQRLSLTDEQLGYFFIAQFSGSLIGTLISQPLTNHLGFIKTIVIGCLAMAIGVFGLNSDTLNICLLAFFINGFGNGITLPSINMLTVELNPENVTSALNFLNFFWGIGAIICKPFIDFFSTSLSIFRPTSILSIALILTGATIFLLPRRIEPQRNQGITETHENLPPVWSTSLAWAIALFSFIHVGFESGAGGWITTYATRFPDQSGHILWLSPITLYFFFFVAGRGIAPLYSKFTGENWMILIGLIIVTTAMMISLLGNTYFFLSIGSAIAGFGTSTIFPTNMARFTKIFGATATRRATPIFICGTLGSTLITFLIGYISNYYKDLRTGMFVLLGSCVVLITLQILLMLRSSIRK
jgi:fucose permease